MTETRVLVLHRVAWERCSHSMALALRLLRHPKLWTEETAFGRRSEKHHLGLESGRVGGSRTSGTAACALSAGLAAHEEVTHPPFS